MPTFELIGHPVLHLDVDEQHGKGQGLVVLVPQGDVPEARSDGGNREESLANQISVVVKDRHTQHGQLREQDLEQARKDELLILKRNFYPGAQEQSAKEL